MDLLPASIWRFDLVKCYSRKYYSSESTLSGLFYSRKSTLSPNIITHRKHCSKILLMMGSDDRSALEELYRATNGPGWNKNTNWCTDSEIESWHGVKTRMCSDGIEHVVELNLPGVYVVIENGCFILLQSLSAVPCTGQRHVRQ
jgi:hypothetical protein